VFNLLVPLTINTASTVAVNKSDHAHGPLYLLPSGQVQALRLNRPVLVGHSTELTGYQILSDQPFNILTAYR